MKFSKTKTDLVVKKYGFYYDSLVKVLIIMWDTNRFYISF